MSYARKWKFLVESDGEIRSRHGDCTWKIGEWQKVEGDLVSCSWGLHASNKISEAFSWTQGDILARVEVRGDALEEDTKSAHSQMRIVRAYRWGKEDSVALAVYAAELVIEIFEQHSPGDDRPRKAIEAAKAYLVNPSPDAADAAYAAARAAARATADAVARAAAYAAAAARAAAYTANAANAANAAAYTADAANAANAAAYTADAANADLPRKVEEWMLSRVRGLSPLGLPR